MSTSTPETALDAQDEAERKPLRLRLSPHQGRGAMDGAWWPQSRDLATEVVDLVDHFPQRLGRIIHTVYSGPDWQTPPRRIKVAKGFVNMGSFPDDDTHVVLLSTDTDGVLMSLLVVPPGTPPDDAERAMSIAATPTNLESGSAILNKG